MDTPNHLYDTGSDLGRNVCVTKEMLSLWLGRIGAGAMIILIDDLRHIVTWPYTVANLHVAASALNIKRCWFSPRPYPHYDSPKRRHTELLQLTAIGDHEVRRVSGRKILAVIKGGEP